MPDTFTTGLSLTKPEVGASDDTWGNKINDDCDVLDAAITSTLSVNVAGGITLDDAQCRNGSLVFTGTLLAATTVNVVAKRRRYHVANQTTGAFSLTVKTPAGAGVTIPQGGSALIFSDGIDVFKVRDFFRPGVAANDLVQLDNNAKLPAVDGSALTHLSKLAIIRTFTASGTWNKPADLDYIVVQVVGGGGAGGGAAATAAGEGSVGGGGGGGGTAIKRIEASALGATETVTVGAGGTGVSGGAGNDGTASTFGSHCTGGQGVGGGPSAANANTGPGGNGGLGGTASGGDINLRGNYGNWGFRNGGGTAVSGGGGSSSVGGGNAREIPTSTSSSATAAAANSGAGGSGPINVGASGARAGGAGGSGIIIVWEYTKS